MTLDLFLSAGELSGDLHGARLIEALLAKNPHLAIGATAGPKMRALPITPYFSMEALQVMGFTDVLFHLPHLVRQFHLVRDKILELQPKAVVCIDYAEFHLRLEASLRKKGYRGRLIHFISPSVWAWRKGRAHQMAKHLDLLLSILPFEADAFSHTPLRVRYIGHPLLSHIPLPPPRPNLPLLALFPGSRKSEVEKNFPLQWRAAQEIISETEGAEIAISLAHPSLEPLLRSLAPKAALIPPEGQKRLMETCRLALATSGTVTLELALHQTPTLVTFAIRPFDQFLAQKIFRIDLPYYSLPNLILQREVFPELFGSHLTFEKLVLQGRRLWGDEKLRRAICADCEEVRSVLGRGGALERASEAILEELQR